MTRFVFIAVSMISSLMQAKPIFLPAENRYLIELGGKFEFFEDVDSKLTIKTIDSVKMQTGKSSFGVIPYPVWINLNVHNPTSKHKSAKIWFKNNRQIASVEVFSSMGQAPLKKITEIGVRRPFINRMYPSKDLVIPLEIPAHKNIRIVLKAHNPEGLATKLAIADSITHAKHDREAYMFYFLFFGAMMIIAIFNLLLFIRLKELPALLYAVYLIGMNFYLLGLSAIDIEYLWSPNIRFYVVFFSLNIACIALLWFTRRFLQVPRFSKTLDRAMQLCALSMILILIEVVVGKHFLTNTNIRLLCYGSCVITIASAIIVALRNGYRPAIPLAIAWTGMLAGAMLKIFEIVNILESSMITMYGMQIGIFWQMAFMSLAIADRIVDSKLEILKLTDEKNSELEKKVEIRTRDIRRIIDNVQSGFFLMTQDYKILPGFTASCREIIAHDFQEGRSLFDYFPMNARLKDSFHGAFLQVFYDTLPESVTLSFVPSLFLVEDRAIRLRYRCIRNEREQIELILVTVTDDTKLIAAEAQAEIDRSIINIFRQKDFFSWYITDFKESIQLLKQEKDPNELKRILHTMKGNLGLFGLKFIAELVHKAEEESPLKKKTINEIEDSFRTYVRRNIEELGITYDGVQKDSFQISMHDIQNFKKAIKQSQNHLELKSAANDFTAFLSAKPIRDILGPMDTLVEDTAIQLGKNIQFSLNGTDLRVFPEKVYPVTKNLVHVIRNSIDHGIEINESERIEKGKPEYGELSLSFTQKGDALCIEVKDDGKGVDVDKIAQIAIKQKILTKDELKNLSDDEKIMLIYRTNFSTRDKENLFSGRGVGMSAIHNAVKSVGGKIEIKTKDGLGTQTTIEIPGALTKWQEA